MAGGLLWRGVADDLPRLLGKGGQLESGGSVGFLDLGGRRRTCTPLELNTWRTWGVCIGIWRTWGVCIGLADLQDWGGSAGLAHLADLGGLACVSSGLRRRWL